MPFLFISLISHGTQLDDFLPLELPIITYTCFNLDDILLQQVISKVAGKIGKMAERAEFCCKAFKNFIYSNYL